jgi:hypothetical protein
MVPRSASDALFSRALAGGHWTACRHKLSKVGWRLERPASHSPGDLGASARLVSWCRALIPTYALADHMAGLLPGSQGGVQKPKRGEGGGDEKIASGIPCRLFFGHFLLPAGRV